MVISNMFYVYVLKSERNGKRYIGSTSKDPITRLREHNGGNTPWTRQNRPFILVYTEKYETKTLALGRERFLKSGQGRKQLDVMLK
ncbi:MAG: GIY-YIG nuclease family protein [Candidatus Terrybacteria bacterium]|nr:GIY-YIG nuclease family protein [Candidatus Terrybacteria bacterium]